MPLQPNRRESDALAGPAKIFRWFRGGDWVFKPEGVAANNLESVESGDRLELLVPPELQNDVASIYSPGPTPYEPLRESPDMYLDFMALGELVWKAGSESLSQHVLSFTRDYGPLTDKPYPTLGDVLEEAKTVSRLGMGQRAMTGEDQVAEIYWLRACEKYGKAFEQSPVLRPGSVEFPNFIARDLEVTVNVHLKTYTVNSQIRRILGKKGQTEGFEPSYEPTSLRGAIWAQLGSSLIRGSISRRCKFVECKRIFSVRSQRSLLNYCPDRNCQSRANDRKKYQRRKAAKLAERNSRYDKG